MALKKREHKPDNNQTSKEMTLSTKFNFKFATLPIFHQKKTTLKKAFIQQKSMKKENVKKRRNSTI